MQLRLIESEKIPYCSDYEINRAIDELTKRLNASGPHWRTSGNRKKKSAGLFLETEICYLQREIMWRRRRERTHAEYLKKRGR
jgi:predicted secreted Zn-dependent protease